VEKKEIIQFRGAQTPLATVMPLQTERPPLVDPIVPTGRTAPRGANNDEGLVQPSTPSATVHNPDH
jgi:hypothetical protein